MRGCLAIFFGRALLVALRVLRSGGSVLPGVLAEFISPGILIRLIGNSEIIFVTGSNGKTSTTRMAVSILRAHGHEVFTNSSGANMKYGIIASLLAVPKRTRKGIALLEVDEGHIETLADLLKPSTALFLNLQVDQLNRFHDPGTVLVKLKNSLAFVKDVLIFNLNEPCFSELLESSLASQKLSVYGFSSSSDILNSIPTTGLLPHLGGQFSPPGRIESLCHIEYYSARTAHFSIQGVDRLQEIQLRTEGVHHAQNAAAAFALCMKILGDEFDPNKASSAVSLSTPAFGRDQVISLAGQPVRILLMKNPRSMQVNLESIAAGSRVMIGIDGGTPDPSWLYDVNLSAIKRAVVTGSMAWQVALALSYAGVVIDLVEPNLFRATNYFLRHSSSDKFQSFYNKKSEVLRKSNFDNNQCVTATHLDADFNRDQFGAKDDSAMVMILNYEMSMRLLRHYRYLDSSCY
ncbi:Mur ligase family protein [Tropheryma whipplei]|uniref:Mur ligase family protein n=1 Tax=Tropheryma whipplei TaxID=2039 RepID=UPI0004B24DB9|nr:Mur ligase family protein [Tropheryma whipplei]